MSCSIYFSSNSEIKQQSALMRSREKSVLLLFYSIVCGISASYNQYFLKCSLWYSVWSCSYPSGLRTRLKCQVQYLYRKFLVEITVPILLQNAFQFYIRSIKFKVAAFRKLLMYSYWKKHIVYLEQYFTLYSLTYNVVQDCLFFNLFIYL